MISRLRFPFVLGLAALWVVLTSYRQAPVFHKNDLLGKFEAAEHPDFVRVPSKYAAKQEEYMRKDALEAFLKMAEAAKKAGFDLIIVSGTRNFNYQHGIWSRKWEGLTGKPETRAKSITTYSSMPGTSRHHWGTDIDIHSVEPSVFESGYGARLYAWLDKHAWEYGYFQPYKNETKGRKGYKDEKWHWSYYPTASRLLKAFNRVVQPEDIAGFEGSELYEPLNIRERYVNGIEPDFRVMGNRPW
jgi:D-alanyl-D-alanine carboxypeptidase